MKKRIMVGAAVFTLLAGIATAQDSGDRVTIPFRDPSGPKKLTVNLINGSVTVRGYDGRDAIVEATGASSKHTRTVAGMHRIDRNLDIDITEENNVIKVEGGISHSPHLLIQVPVQTSVVARVVNGGSLVVENISGEIDANNTNGSVEITNVSGSVLANSQNGKVVVSLNKVTPGKAMSFTSFNGKVEVTLPADVKANLMMKTNNGEILVDDGFDIKLDPTNHPPIVEDNRSRNGKYRVRLDRGVYGTINGGGPEMQFVTYNGSIYIHKK